MRSFAARVAGFALVCLALGACGGGGSGSGAEPVLRVSGTAAKGLLAFAEVTVRAIGPAGPIDRPLLTTRTDAQGAFGFDLLSLRQPVLVTVRSLGGSLMQDETRIGANGDFAWTAAPEGLQMRAIIADPRGSAMTLSVNPFTEAATTAAASAIDDAGRSIAWSPAGIAAGQQLAELLAPTGVDPFATLARPLSAAVNASLQEQLMLVALAGFASTGAPCHPGAPESRPAPSKANCRLDYLRQISRVVVSGSDVLLPTADALRALRSDLYGSAVQALGTSALAPLAQVAALDDAQIPGRLEKAQGFVDPDRSIRDFIDVLRLALRKLPSELDLVERLIAGRYAGFPANGVLDVVRKGAAMLGECYFYAQAIEPSTALRCDGEGWTSNGGEYVRMIADASDPGIVTQQTARAEYDPTQGYAVRYTLQRLRPRVDGPAVPEVSAELVARGEGGRPWEGFFVNERLQVTGSLNAVWGERTGQQATLGLRGLSLNIDPGWTTHVNTQGEVTLRLSDTDPTLADGLGGEINLSLEPRWTAGKLAALQPVAFSISLRPRIGVLGPELQPTLTVSGSGAPAVSYEEAQGYGLRMQLDLGGRARLTALSSRLAGGPSSGLAVLTIGDASVQLALDNVGPLGPYCLPRDIVPATCGDAIRLTSSHGQFQAVFHRIGETVDLLRKGRRVGQIDKRGIVEYDLGDGTGVTYSLY